MKRISIIIMISILLAACGSGTERGAGGPGSTNVTINLGQSSTYAPSFAQAGGVISSSSFSHSSTSMPVAINTIRCQVTDGAGGTVLADITVNVAGLTSVQIVLNVANGSGRVFTIYGYSSLGTLIYQGQTTADLNGSTVSLPITILAVSSGSWTHPSDLYSYINFGTDDAGDNEVAMDNNGNVIVIWSQDDGSGNYQLYISEYRNGIWTHPANSSDFINPAGDGVFDVEVAMDNNGSAIIAWFQGDGNGNYYVYKSEYRNGTWTHPTDINDYISPVAGNEHALELAMDNNGNAIVLWEHHIIDSGGIDQVFMSEYRNETWTHPANINDYISPGGVADCDDPEVAMDDNGNAIIAWLQDVSGVDLVFMSEYRNGTWTHPANINDYISPGVRDVNYLDVVMSNKGSAIIVWDQDDGSNNDQVLLSEYRNGSWIHPASLNDYISPGITDVDAIDVTMDNNDNAIIVWEQYDSTDSYESVFMSEYRNGSWIHPVNLSDNISPGATDIDSPRVSMDDAGGAIIVWNQDDGSNNQIFKSEYRSNSWTHPSGISDNISPNGQDALLGDIAMDNNANAIIIWTQSDGSNNQLFKSEYR